MRIIIISQQIIRNIISCHKFCIMQNIRYIYFTWICNIKVSRHFMIPCEMLQPNPSSQPV